MLIISILLQILFFSNTCEISDAFSLQRVGKIRLQHSKVFSSTINDETILPETTSAKNKKKSATQWIACSSTKEVNRAINVFVKSGDVAVELGSQLRQSSTDLCERVGPDGKVLLVDVKRNFPKKSTKAKEQKRMLAMRMEGDEVDFYKDRAIFEELDTFDCWRRVLFFQDWTGDIAAATATATDTDTDTDTDTESGIITAATPTPHFNVLVLDASAVSGNDMILNCVSIIKEFIALNNSESKSSNTGDTVIIVKSGELSNLARRLVHAQRLFSGATTLKRTRRASIIGTVGVEEYRRTIPYVINKGDVCLEIGSHFGTSTVLLDAAARIDDDDDVNQGSTMDKDTELKGGCLGVDIGQHIIERARTRFPDVAFAVGDAWRTADLVKMKEKYLLQGSTTSSSSKSGYDVVFVDVGGLSGSEGILEAISLLLALDNALEPRHLVIKSLCIRRLASSLVPFSEVWKKEKRKEEK